jgi:hypothetical protein
VRLGHNYCIICCTCSDAVRSNKITSGASNDEVERVVREWLRTAKDRSGGRRMREKLTGARLVNPKTVETMPVNPCLYPDESEQLYSDSQ